MPFLNKRSDSQRSFDRGDDQITVRKIQPNDKQSAGHDGSCDLGAASRSSRATTTSFALENSCVARKFPKHKSSHLRFLAWVAYTRKFTDEPITDEERRTCPLLWCRSLFDDQEEMLQHVWSCEHLSKGLYWCYHCQRPEQVGKFQCKRCQGLPSRTDRIATVAKRIFSRLGSKNILAQRSPPPKFEVSLAKVPEVAKSQKKKDYDQVSVISDTGPVGDWGQSTITGDWEGTFQELPDTQIYEMNESVSPVELSAEPDSWADMDYENFQESYNETPVASNSASKATRRPDTVLPPLDTRSLSHLQQDFPPPYSDHWPKESMADTIVSPLSTVNNLISPFHEISPTDTVASGRSFFTDSGYTSGTIGSCATSPPDSFDMNPGFNESRGKKRTRDCDKTSEETTRNAAELSVMTMESPNTDPGSVGSTNSSHSPSRCPSTKKPKMQSPYWSTGSSLVKSFSEVLDAHICHTKEILRGLPPTPIITELLAMSRGSMVSIGLEALVAIIEGRNPSAIVQAFAFTHIACAFSIAIDHDEIKVHTQEWFHDSLSWIAGLGSTRQRNRYAHIAKAIWQPVESLRESNLPRLFLAGDDDNRLFQACKRFLDVLESLSSSEVTPSPTTDKASRFPPSLFAQKAQQQVIEPLIKTASIEAFIEDVVKVEKRLNRNHITNVRELELELMCAGKLASQSELAYTRFLSHVTTLCDSLYESSHRSRTSFHIADISHIKELLPEEIYSEHDEDQEFELELEDDLPGDFGMEILEQRGGKLREYVNEYSRDVDESLRDDCVPVYGFSTHPQSTATTAPTTQSHFQPKQVLHPEGVGSTQTSELYSGCDVEGLYLVPTSSSNSLLSPPSKLQSPAPSTLKHTRSSSSSSPQPSRQTYQCPHCPYIPTGQEQYKASNLRRHKRTLHPSSNVKGSYMCRWPGCGRNFTRSDNLRSHMKGKGHVMEFGVGGHGSDLDEDCGMDGEEHEHGAGGEPFGSDSTTNKWGGENAGCETRVTKRRRQE